MDLDKLLAALQAAAGPPAEDAPLIATDMFVPPSSDDPEGDTDASRRLVAAFAYWLVEYKKVAPDLPPERSAIFSRVASRPEEGATVVEELGDRLLPSDVHSAWKRFATDYLAPAEGSLADDYFKLFVEAPGKRSLRDALPTRSDYDQLARRIETRAERHQQGVSDWRAAADVPGAPEPSLWKGGTKDEWLRRIGTYEDLMDSLPRDSRARIEEYWSLVDAAPSMPDAEVASALARTYLWVDDSSIQTAVYRTLGAFPLEPRIQGILANIVEIESKTTWADEVVDVFPDDLGTKELRLLAEAIRASPADQQGAYSRALTRAAQNGSRHAARLLRLLST